MKSFKDPSFQDRLGRAAEAKQTALDNLRAKPPVDESIVAARRASRMKREAAETERRAAKKAAGQAVKDAKSADAAAKSAAIKAPPTEAERKLARDARYAARKNRK